MVLSSRFGKNCRNALFLLLVVFSSAWLQGCPKAAEPGPEVFSYAIVNSYPHDAAAFTQGLAWDQGRVYEGTGLYGRSSLRLVDLQTGRVERLIEHGQQIFAEGITVFGDRIYQLTWKNNIVLAYDKEDFTLIKSWPFPGEGWGITHDGRNLIVSDGSSTLYFLDPDTLREKRRVTVADRTGRIQNLNELEYVKGAVFANIWKSDRIAMIDPGSGRVTGWLDLSGLQDSTNHDGQTKVLNGIMYAPEEDRLFITGKLWPVLFEIRLIPAY